MRLISVLLCFVILTLPVSVNAGKRYYSLSPDQIVSYVLKKRGQRQALFVYASWCGYCRAAMPTMVSLSKDYPGAVTAVSIDEKPGPLARYMEQYDERGFSLIVWNREQNLPLQLGRIGIKLTPGIPFTALLDEKGRVVKQGNLDVKDVAAYIRSGRL